MIDRSINVRIFRVYIFAAECEDVFIVKLQ